MVLNTLEEQLPLLKFGDDVLERDNIDIIIGSNCLDKMFADNFETRSPEDSSAGKQINELAYCHSSFDIDDALKKFWEVEELPSKSTHVEHFKRNIRTRLVIKLPLKEDISKLSDESVTSQFVRKSK